MAECTLTTHQQGIIGFRVDAAKHIPTDSVGSIFGGLSKAVLLTQVCCRKQPGVKPTDCQMPGNDWQ